MSIQFNPYARIYVVELKKWGKDPQGDSLDLSSFGETLFDLFSNAKLFYSDNGEFFDEAAGATVQRDIRKEWESYRGVMQ